jgi:hypothetical protein
VAVSSFAAVSIIAVNSCASVSKSFNCASVIAFNCAVVMSCLLKNVVVARWFGVTRLG